MCSGFANLFKMYPWLTHSLCVLDLFLNFMGKKGNCWKYQSNSIISYDDFFVSAINKSPAVTPRPVWKPLKAVHFLYLLCEGQIEWRTTRLPGFRNSPKPFCLHLPVMWISNCSKKSNAIFQRLRSWDERHIKVGGEKRRRREVRTVKGFDKMSLPIGL